MSTQHRTADADSLRWELTAKRYRHGRFMDPLLAEQFRRVHRDLVRRWSPESHRGRVLKTDVFAEATCPPRAFSWDLCPAERLVSVEISTSLTTTAHENAVALGHGAAGYVAGDARVLPFANDAFDLIVSDSTLDHFGTTGEILTSLKEMARVLRPGGTLVITLDNPANLLEPLFRLWLRAGHAPYFIGRTLSHRKLGRALRECGLDVTDATAILHQPRYFAKAGLRLLRRTGGRRHDRLIRWSLATTERLERWPTRFQTGLFVAVRAVKPAPRTPVA
ncbi:MAG: methyltransferase domain-containing protein [Dehalococcoidia bacterium]|jgi:SAM-dependent methyltransferase|nr:methyltransferase domain-containing protein [Dehalococcoidia bacterium]